MRGTREGRGPSATPKEDRWRWQTETERYLAALSPEELSTEVLSAERLVMAAETYRDWLILAREWISGFPPGEGDTR